MEETRHEAVFSSRQSIRGFGIMIRCIGPDILCLLVDHLGIFKNVFDPGLTFGIQTDSAEHIEAEIQNV